MSTQICRSGATALLSPQDAVPAHGTAGHFDKQPPNQHPRVDSALGPELVSATPTGALLLLTGEVPPPEPRTRCPARRARLGPIAARRGGAADKAPRAVSSSAFRWGGEDSGEPSGSSTLSRGGGGPRGSRTGLSPASPRLIPQRNYAVPGPKAARTTPRRTRRRGTGRGSRRPGPRGAGGTRGRAVPALLASLPSPRGKRPPPPAPPLPHPPPGPDAPRRLLHAAPRAPHARRAHSLEPAALSSPRSASLRPLAHLHASAQQSAEGGRAGPHPSASVPTRPPNPAAPHAEAPPLPRARRRPNAGSAPPPSCFGARRGGAREETHRGSAGRPKRLALMSLPGCRFRPIGSALRGGEGRRLRCAEPGPVQDSLPVRVGPRRA